MSRPLVVASYRASHEARRNAAEHRHAGGAAQREAWNHPFGADKQAEIRTDLSRRAAELEVFFPVVAGLFEPDEIAGSAPSI